MSFKHLKMLNSASKCLNAILYSIQFSRVLVPAGTSNTMLRHHSIHRPSPGVMAYVANAVTLRRCLQQCVLAALN
jgi:hypothetical protein